MPTSSGDGRTIQTTTLLLRRQTPLPLSRLLRRSCAHPSQLAQIHTRMIKTGLDLLPFPIGKLLAAAALVDTAYARAVFAGIASPNLFHHNALLRGCSVARSPAVDEALRLFRSLRARGLPLDQFTFVCVLKASARSLALRAGRQIHCVAAKIGFGIYVNVRNALMHLYGCCRGIQDARLMFDEMPLMRDAVSFGTMMNVYLQAAQPENVVGLFREMRACSLEANASSIVSTLSAASASLDDGGCSCSGVESLHGYCIKSGFDSELNVSTALVSCYTKTGHMDSAKMVFNSMNGKDVVLYNCMVDGYAKGGAIEEALGCVQKMRDEGVKPNASTYAGLLAACAASGFVSVGRHIHECINKEFLELDAVLGTALVDMYSKGGCINEAVDVFERMSSRDVKAWTAMIMGLGVHGQAEAALELFYEMEDKGVRPNEVTFLAVLSACSHGGLVSSAKECFEKMVCRYGLAPKMEHYGCLIDLLARAGLLEEAHDLVKGLTLEGDATAWRALLAACRLHGNIELAELAQEALVSLGDGHPSDSILLATTYTIAGRSMSTTQVENKVMTKKAAGFSSIEMDG